jgi:flagellar hook-basal body complex protein FliE
MLQSVQDVQSLSELHGLAPPAADRPTGQAAAAEFVDVLAQVAGDAVGTIETAEAAAIRAIHGRATTQDVVESIIAAEQTLQAAIAVRDRIVAAYQELSRMQI